MADAAGTDLGDAFDDHVVGRELPPIDELVAAVGLRWAPEAASDDTAPEPPDLGVEIVEDDRGVTVTTALRDGPAWRAGLTGGDRILAIDGLAVARGQLPTALRAYEPGRTVEIAVFRGPRLLTLPVTLDAPLVKRRLVAAEEPTDDQRTAFQRWTGRPLAEAPTPG